MLEIKSSYKYIKVFMLRYTVQGSKKKKVFLQVSQINVLTFDVYLEKNSI